jgi:hypothetical protein
VTPGVPNTYSLDRLDAEFLTSAFKDRSETTRGFNAEKLDPLVAHLGEEFPADGLKPLHVEAWVALHPGWKKGTIRTVWQAVQRLMRWGERTGRTAARAPPVATFPGVIRFPGNWSSPGVFVVDSMNESASSVWCCSQEGRRERWRVPHSPRRSGDDYPRSPPGLPDPSPTHDGTGSSPRWSPVLWAQDTFT